MVYGCVLNAHDALAVLIQCVYGRSPVISQYGNQSRIWSAPNRHPLELLFQFRIDMLAIPIAILGAGVVRGSIAHRINRKAAWDTIKPSTDALRCNDLVDAIVQYRNQHLLQGPFRPRSPDNHTIVFAMNESQGGRSAPTIYTIQDNGRRLTRLSSSAPAASGDSETHAGCLVRLRISALKNSMNRIRAFLPAAPITVGTPKVPTSVTS